MDLSFLLSSEERALQQGTVMSCVSLISDTLSQLPIDAFRGTGPTKTEITKPRVLEAPGGVGVPWEEWLGQNVVSLLLRGNAYGYIAELDGRFYPSVILMQHPDETKVELDKTTGQVLYTFPGQEPTRRWPLGRAWHVKGMTLPGTKASIKGLSPIEYQARTISTALEAERYGYNWFRDSAIPPGYLGTDQELDDDEAKDLKDRWDKAHGGGQQGIAVMANGLKFETINVTPDQAQFLATIRAKREEIAGWYRVPLHMIGMADKQSNWGTGVEENGRQFVMFTLGIWLKRFEAALTSVLPVPQYVKFNVDGLLRARYLDRMQGYQIERQIGTLNIDEIRELEDRHPLADDLGTGYDKPLNWGPVLPPPPPEPAPVTPDAPSEP